MKKKTLILTGLVATVLIAGCNQNRELLYPTTSKLEEDMFKSFDNQFFKKNNTYHSYDLTVQAMLVDRIDNLPGARKGENYSYQESPNLNEYPFCRYYSEVIEDELIWKIQNPTLTTPNFLTTQFKEMYGKPMRTLCNIKDDSKKVVEKTVETVTVKADNTISGRDEQAISPEMYDMLIDAAKTCNRTKVKLLSLTENKEFLTYKDYDSIMATVMKCKAFEIEQVLNEG